MHLLKQLVDEYARRRLRLRSLAAEHGIKRPHLARRFMRRHVNAQAKDLSIARQIKASIESVDYIDRHMAHAAKFFDPYSHLRHALQCAPSEGLALEFGVWSGATINIIAKYRKGLVHGFDSFRGLPEDWSTAGYSVGSFDTEGVTPKVSENVRLHVGWFDETLPKFMAENPEGVAFVHIDCDLYSSTKTVLANLADRLMSGCVIVFDEYFAYPGWREHEHKALKEFIAETDLKYEYISYNERAEQVAVRIC